MSRLVRTFYKRQLPPGLVAFASEEGKNLFKSALTAGSAEIYFQLANNFTTQSEPAFCGLGSLSMALNSLEIDPLRVWKGPWRWYADEMLDCCRSLEDIREKGITLSEFGCLARCNGLDVRTIQGDSIQFEQFEQDLIIACSSQNQVMVVSYSRQVLDQTGEGHFSPVGAYHREGRMALILDVARFKYPAYWVSLDKLYASLQPCDPMTNLPRGYAILQKKQSLNSSLTQLTISKSDWKDIVTCWKLKTAPENNPSDSQQEFWTSLFNCYIRIVTSTATSKEDDDFALIAKRIVVMQEDESKPPIRFSCNSSTTPEKELVGMEFRTQFELLVVAIRATLLYRVFKSYHFDTTLTVSSASKPFSLELATLFFMSIPYRSLFGTYWPDSLLTDVEATAQDFHPSSPSLEAGCGASTCGCVGASTEKAEVVLQYEVAYIQDQMKNLNRCVIEEAHS